MGSGSRQPPCPARRTVHQIDRGHDHRFASGEGTHQSFRPGGIQHATIRHVAGVDVVFDHFASPPVGDVPGRPGIPQVTNRASPRLVSVASRVAACDWAEVGWQDPMACADEPVASLPPVWRWVAPAWSLTAVWTWPRTWAWGPPARRSRLG